MQVLRRTPGSHSARRIQRLPANQRRLVRITNRHHQRRKADLMQDADTGVLLPMIGHRSTQALLRLSDKMAVNGNVPQSVPGLSGVECGILVA